LKREWTQNSGAFRQFLNWLDEGVDSGGERYLEMRRRLVFYFERRNCLAPDELADETLNRVSRRLEEEGSIATDSPAHYCYIVAKFVFLESIRARENRQTNLDDLAPSQQAASAMAVPPSSGGDNDSQEKRYTCLENCLRKLQTSDQELILSYYQGERRAKIEHRSQLAERLGLTANALSIRACRIRSRLELCVRTCSQTS
jgi:hypothetical protein